MHERVVSMKRSNYRGIVTSVACAYLLTAVVLFALAATLGHGSNVAAALGVAFLVIFLVQVCVSVRHRSR